MTSIPITLLWKSLPSPPWTLAQCRESKPIRDVSSIYEAWANKTWWGRTGEDDH